MIFFQTCPDIFITKLKKSYAFIQDKIEKNILKGYSLKVPNLIVTNFSEWISDFLKVTNSCIVFKFIYIFK